MRYERFIAYRHLTRRRKSGFISLISVISIGGVAVGVMALIVVLAVMSGFDKELKAKFVNVQPHLRVEKYGGIDSLNADIHRIKQSQSSAGIRTITGFVEGQAIIRSLNHATGVLVKGLDPFYEDLSVYRKKMIAGELNFESVTIVNRRSKKFFIFDRKAEEKEIGSVVIGYGLARKLRVQIGDNVNLISPFRDESDQFSLGSAEVKTFIVRGIFQMGMNEFDTGLALISLPKAQQIYHLGTKVSGISMRFEDVDQAERVKPTLAGVLGNEYLVRSWYDLNQNFFQALKVEKSVMTILLALIILVATFNIVSTLTMVVMEKTKDIGILRAIGATRKSIRKIFVIEGFTIGFLGVLVGTLSGLALATHLNEVSDFIKDKTGFEVFPSDIYYFDKIPAEIIPQDVAMTLGFAILASIFAGLYPAHRAASLNPIEALRYE